MAWSQVLGALHWVGAGQRDEENIWEEEKTEWIAKQKVPFSAHFPDYFCYFISDFESDLKQKGNAVWR